jgi:hypothetical protein
LPSDVAARKRFEVELVLVSHLRQFIYTKTVKTAGTSVESYFERFCMPDDQWQESHERDEYVSPAGIIGVRGPFVPEGCLWWNHMPAALIRERLGEEIWVSYFKFCVVRNPFEKMLSFFYFQRRAGHAIAQRGEADAAHFERWLAAAPRVPLDNDKYLIDGRLCVDFVARYETLHADLAAICAKLGLPWQPRLLPAFKTGIRPPASSAAAMYTATAADAVRSAYAWEFDHFGYSREVGQTDIVRSRTGSAASQGEDSVPV